MRVSIVFLLHLIGFGVLCTSLLAGFILDRKFRAQTDYNLKLITSGIARTIGLLSPVAAVIMLATGIGNIHTRYSGSPLSWFDEGWLAAKIILFVVLVFNGMVYGPRLTRGRTKLVKEFSAQTAPANAEVLMRSYNSQITLFYFVQTVVLFLILFLSLFGPGKHPGLI
ncbi:MAG: hypothetical protein NTU47_06650 [Ignavibacteriales bacterium]|nr:hypothetical protein [Ignavibacteriales bacterium]